jgi:hypothetical protein
MARNRKIINITIPKWIFHFQIAYKSTYIWKLPKICFLSSIKLGNFCVKLPINFFICIISFKLIYSALIKVFRNPLRILKLKFGCFVLLFQFFKLSQHNLIAILLTKCYCPLIPWNMFPYECQLLEIFICEQNWYCMTNEVKLWQCEDK